MQEIRRWKKRLASLKPFSRLSLKLGFYLMLCFYIVALAARFIAPFAANYFYAMAVYRGSLEAAPACLAVGVIACLLSDLALRDREERG